MPSVQTLREASLVLAILATLEMEKHVFHLVNYYCGHAYHTYSIVTVTIVISFLHVYNYR